MGKKIDGETTRRAPGAGSLVDRARRSARLGRHREAVRLYLRAANSLPAHGAILLEAGNRMARAGRYAEAARLYQAAAPEGDGGGRLQDPRPLFNAGYALARLGRPFAAARAYRRYLEYVPGDADAWFNLGNVLREAGADRRARDAYERALALAPDDHEALNNLGNALASVGRHGEAIAAYQKVVGLRPAYHAAWNNLGNALASLGRQDEAVACYARAIRASGGRELLYFFNRALAHLAAGRMREAASDVGRSSTLLPFYDSDARSARVPDWLRFLQSLSPPRTQRGAV